LDIHINYRFIEKGEKANKRAKQLRLVRLMSLLFIGLFCIKKNKMCLKNGFLIVPKKWILKNCTLSNYKKKKKKNQDIKVTR
jgi:hypothetical protein